MIRWTALVGLVIVALAVVYRLAPDRDAPQFRWVSVGALVAALLWLAGSAAFSLYVNYFGNYNKTYGALGGVVVLMLWMYLTSYIVLLGAEINAESEKPDPAGHHDGAERPMGERGLRGRHRGRPAGAGEEEVTGKGTVTDPAASARRGSGRAGSRPARARG